MLICCSNMTTRKRVLLLGGLVLLAALLPSVSAGQPAPLTPEIQVSGAPSTSQYLPSVAAEPDGGFVVAWLEGSNPSERTIRARRFTASGAAATEILRVSQTALPDLFEGPAVAVHAASGRFLVVWGAVEAVLGRVFDASGAPLTGEIEIHRYPQRGLFFPSVTASPDGFVVAWMMASSVSGSSAIFAHRYDSAGAPLGSELRVDAGTVSFAQKPMVAADSTGGFVVVWEQGSLQTRVAGRLFDPAGMPRTGELQLGEPVDVQAQNPSVAVAPDGGFFVIWERSRRVTDIVGRLFGADGAPRGPAARLNETRSSVRLQPRVAADPGGGYFAVWSQLGALVASRGRRIDAAGQPRGPQFQLGHQQSGFPSGVTAAFSAAGELVAAWHGLLSTGPSGVIAQRFRFSGFAGGDPCVVSGSRLACDTLRAGGPALEIPFDVLPGDGILLGNLNGDLQDDPCFYRAGTFSCDLDHDGTGEVHLSFAGAPGDVPLLGDLNGDGLDDPCVRRVRRFACDTAHNGGKAEVQVIFGLKGDLPLLGDVDGDGDDDPCLYRAGRFLCDTAHDGGGAEVAVAFGLAGDTPLLGDMDGDGREDFCVFRGGRFLCDTAHDGGGAEVEILFGEPGAVPLLGNVDGY